MSDACPDCAEQRRFADAAFKEAERYRELALLEHSEVVERAKRHAYCPMWKAMYEERKAQLNDLNTRLVQQRRRLRELEEKQADAARRG